jgi:predicted DNA-binding protein with PD1-like motif
MQAQLLHEVDGEKTFLLVFEKGDELMGLLERFAREHELSGSHFTAIGAFERGTLGYFDWQRKDYDRIPVDEQVEVLTLVGDIALDGDTPKVHAHVVLGTSTGAAIGGHVLEAFVRPTLELTLTETPSATRRVHDPESGLALIRPAKRAGAASD